MSDRYRLTLVSPVPVVHVDGRAFTLDLWARDLEEQLRVARVRLICPVQQMTGALLPVPAEIEIVPLPAVDGAALTSAIEGCDVVQVHAVDGWWQSRVQRRLVAAARAAGVKSIVGITSNRALTAWQNSRGVRRLAGAARYVSVRLAQLQLTAAADGTFVIGEGLRGLVSRRCRALHVGVASWIHSGEGFVSAGPRTSLCIASRLERMKGVHLGIAAYRQLAGYSLTIYGSGPERDALQAPGVSFAGTLAYPQPFLSHLRRHGLVLLTNLGDEQPRLLFDAISQGCIPVCPDAPAYRALGLPQAVYYRRGSVDSLREAIERLQGDDVLPALRALLREHTLQAMHARRAEWIRRAVLRSGG
jgi:glycosyltransferase involved in cell wall biosynthesis